MPEKMIIHSAWGEEATVDAVDGRRAVQNHPDEWSTKPFPESGHKKAAEKKAEREAQERAVQASQRAAAVPAPVQIDKKMLDEAIKTGVEEELRKREQEAREASPDGQAAKQAAEDEAAWRADLGKMSNAQLTTLAKEENVAIEGDDNKASIIDKIVAARKLAAAEG